MSRKSFSWMDFVPVTFVTILFILQIIVGIILLSEVSQIQILAYVGVGLYVFSGIVFGWLPVIEFRKKGGVRKGKTENVSVMCVEADPKDCHRDSWIAHDLKICFGVDVVHILRKPTTKFHEGRKFAIP